MAPAIPTCMKTKIDSAVKKEMDAKIDQVVSDSSLTRADAATILLRRKPSWYVQTPEGEYLAEIAYSEQSAGLQHISNTTDAIVEGLRGGTPKTLRAAIEIGCASMGAIRSEPHVEDAVRDYLSQKFSTAMLDERCNETTLAVLNDLWKSITGDQS